MNPKSMKPILLTRMLVSSGILIGLSVTGCAVSSGDDVADVVDVGVSAQPLVLPDPNGVYFAEVTANGTGCPAGTWDTAISEDGKTFTTTFSAYEAFLEPPRSVVVKDCQLGITLHSPQGLSYSVESFYYQGYAFLDPGVMGRQTANYYFMGNPVDHAELRTDLRGFYDDSYLFQDDVGIADLVWSPCGTERNLNVTTRLRVQNNRQRTGTGYMNLTAVDAASRLILRLAWRTC